jgi:GNAT superfamily N-acetyltransferase
MIEQPIPADIELKIHEIHHKDDQPAWTDWDRLAGFLHESLKPYQDTVADIRRGIDDAFEVRDGRGGFVLIAEALEEPVGALVMLRTGMSGYVPENLLLFVAVAPGCRGFGIGQRLVQRALELAVGRVKLHVEYNNPARKLYERMGFQTKYAEMRYNR